MSRIRTVYVERQVADHPRTAEVIGRLRSVRIVPCERYGEVFNPKAQSFRLQKAGPALVLAAKHESHTLPAPTEYNVGCERNFYFSHLLNCPYDCRYCFLQGMFRSANYVLFVNYESFQEAIDRRLASLPEGEVFFYSGYDCDSLAMEGLTGFCRAFLPFFAERPRAWLELRTKSASLGPLLASDPFGHCVVAASFTPEVAHRRWEAGVPPLDRRLRALAALGEAGWRLGLRFDPLIWWPDAAAAYRELFETVFGRLEESWIHSVSLGAFRLPAPFFRRMADLYPEEPLFAAPLERRDSMITYREDLARELSGECAAALERFVPAAKLFPIR